MPVAVPFGVFQLPLEHERLGLLPKDILSAKSHRSFNTAPARPGPRSGVDKIMANGTRLYSTVVCEQSTNIGFYLERLALKRLLQGDFCQGLSSPDLFQSAQTKPFVFPLSRRMSLGDRAASTPGSEQPRKQEILSSLSHSNPASLFPFTIPRGVHWRSH